MTEKLLASATAAEPLIAAAVLGIGAEVNTPGTGVLAAGLGWFLLVVIDRIRRVV